MSKTTKKWLIAAASLVAIGAILFAAAMTKYHWDFSCLSTEKYETSTHEIREPFSSIQLNTVTADIRLAPAEDNTCKVICYEEEKMKHSVSVQNGTLTICAIDERNWHEHISFSFHSPKVTVYLPKAEYTSLTVKETTGNIKINTISVNTIDLSVSTGDISLSDVICKGDTKTNITTGAINVASTVCQNFVSTGNTGDIILKDVNVTKKIEIQRETGDVTFDHSDAAEISVKTTTGSVIGSLLTEKIFTVKSSTGDIHVPETKTGGTCEIITVTGDIKLNIV